MTVVMDVEALNAFVAEQFPQVAEDYRIDSVEDGEVAVRLMAREQHLRPGGTISGPTMFTLADLAVYMLVLSKIGPVALAVTTNASIDFLRKPEAGRDMIGTARLLKLGKSLVVADVLMRNEGSEAVLARASMTYAIPPKGSAARG